MVVKKRSKKESREFKALLGLIDLYIKQGKPIGSSTLQENGFETLSSATIRNYFAELEKEGYLMQPHASGGRLPTTKGLKFYAEEAILHPELSVDAEERLLSLRQGETKNLATYLQNAAEKLSQITGFATFLTSPRFDHDFINDIKLVAIDATRLLAVLVTNFGEILTETLQTENKLSSFSLKRLENYFLSKLNIKKTEESLTRDEEELAQKFYNEIMVRYLVRYSNFSEGDIYRTGFSKLLIFPEFNDPLSLTAGLSLFENAHQMRQILNDCENKNEMSYWIGEDLNPYSVSTNHCACIATPYHIQHHIAGAIGIFGPTRMPYKALFATLELTSKLITETLTKSLYKFKLTFRAPKPGATYPEGHRWHIDYKQAHLIDIKEKS